MRLACAQRPARMIRAPDRDVGVTRRVYGWNAAKGSAAWRSGWTVVKRGRGGKAGSDGASTAVRAAHQRGFTATELLVALAVVGVLVTLAVPGFAALARSVGLSSAANELLLALHTARSAAVLRGLARRGLSDSGRSNVRCRFPTPPPRGGSCSCPMDRRRCHARPSSARCSRASSLPNQAHRQRIPPDRHRSGPLPALPPPARSTCATSKASGRSIIVSQTGRPRVATEVTSCA